MNNTKKTLIIATALLNTIVIQPAHAQGSAQHVSQAVVHSTQAVGHSVAGGATLVSGVVAVPLIAVGASGQASQQTGEALWDIANQPIGTALPVSDETITAGPSPSLAIKE